MSKNATKVQIEGSDGVIIKGTLVSPPNASDYILMLHGITVDREEYLGFFSDAANDLAQHGIGSLRIDFRGHGESRVPQREFTIRSQKEDTGAALKWLRGEYPTATLSILGTSFGAPPAIFAASKDPTIKRLLLVAPVLDYRRTFLEPETDWAAQSFNAQSIQEACSDDLSLRARYQEFGEMLAIGSTRYETVRLLDLQDWQKLYVERQKILAQRLRKAESHSQHITVRTIQAAIESLNSFEPDDLLKFVDLYNGDIFRWRQALRSGQYESH